MTPKIYLDANVFARLGQCQAFVTAGGKIDMPDDLTPIGIDALTLAKIRALA